ncbi:kinase-like domain-containing protein [Mycena rosella]|uniref:non-specific serine/threonine protein kinase n=1 Tax=Mycena rosella TaxID=1033263 RepID=A0AAD7GBJ5_MYCRO|nr:kinase-like domain-containing protein [Mycena rosella]
MNLLGIICVAAFGRVGAVTADVTRSYTQAKKFQSPTPLPVSSQMFRLLTSARDVLLRRPGPASRSMSTIPVTRAPSSLPPNLDQTQFLPVAKGELFSGRYEALRTLGRGIHSTVWLVRDIRTQQEAAMKVMVASLTNNNRGPDELGIMTILRDSSPESLGKVHTCQLLDSFVHDGPHGSHICLILELMGMSIADVYLSFRASLPLILVQRVAKHVLLGLQYVHAAGVIHTGDNILMTGVGFAEGQSTVNVDVGDLISATYKLSDFGSANKMSRRWAAMIQPVALRSPEVLIDAPWDTKTDIWNFGCLMYEFARGAVLFNPTWQNEQTGMDRTQTHLAQMSGLLGEFPDSFLAKGEKTKDYFDESGRLLRPGAYEITLSDLLSHAGHSSNELPPAVDFLSRALTIDPEVRWSAAQLLEHPWMQNIGPRRI